MCVLILTPHTLAGNVLLLGDLGGKDLNYTSVSGQISLIEFGVGCSETVEWKHPVFFTLNITVFGVLQNKSGVS